MNLRLAFASLLVRGVQCQSPFRITGTVAQNFFDSNRGFDASGLDIAPDGSHLVAVGDKGGVMFLNLKNDRGHCVLDLDDDVKDSKFEGVAIDTGSWTPNDMHAYIIHEGSEDDEPYLHKIKYEFNPGISGTCSARVVDSKSLYYAIPCLETSNGISSLGLKAPSSDTAPAVFFVGIQDRGKVYEVTSEGLSNGQYCYDGGVRDDGIKASAYNSEYNHLWTRMESKDVIAVVDPSEDCAVATYELGSSSAHEEGMAFDWTNGQFYLAVDGQGDESYIAVYEFTYPNDLNECVGKRPESCTDFSLCGGGPFPGQSPFGLLGYVAEDFLDSNRDFEASGLDIAPDGSHLVSVGDGGDMMFLNLKNDRGHCVLDLDDAVEGSDFEGVAIDPGSWTPDDMHAYIVHEGSEDDEPYLYKIKYEFNPSSSGTCSARVVDSNSLYDAIPCLETHNGIESLGLKSPSSDTAPAVFFVGIQDRGKVYEVTSEGLSNGQYCYDGGVRDDGIKASAYNSEYNHLWTHMESEDTIDVVDPSRDCALATYELGSSSTDEEGIAFDWTNGRFYLAVDGRGDGSSIAVYDFKYPDDLNECVGKRPESCTDFSLCGGGSFPITTTTATSPASTTTATSPAQNDPDDDRLEESGGSKRYGCKLLQEGWMRMCLVNFAMAVYMNI